MWVLLHNLFSPKKFYYFSKALLPWLSAAFLITLIYGLSGALYFAPSDYQQGDGFRIIYVHAPCAFLSLFIYGFMATAAVLGLVWQIKIGFLAMKQSAALGACFTLLALITGSLWGKPMWGTWWIWDARLTSELILLFLYVGILIFKSALVDKRNGDRILAILVLIGFIDIPIIHYSVYWWNTLHQGATLKLFAPSTIDASMRYPLIAMIGAFLLYYFIVLILRVNYQLLLQMRFSHD